MEPSYRAVWQLESYLAQPGYPSTHPRKGLETCAKWAQIAVSLAQMRFAALRCNFRINREVVDAISNGAFDRPPITPICGIHLAEMLPRAPRSGT